MILLLALLACGAPAEPAPTEPEAAAEVVPAEEEAPMGSIGGEPILPKPVVIGGIEASAVEEGVAKLKAGIDGCYESERAAHPDLAGKVLVKFVIAKNGTVTSASTKSTSLRHPPTETCLNERIAEGRFAALERGEMAVVTYPFVFPR